MTQNTAVVHVVLAQWRDDATERRIEEIRRSVRWLGERIPGITRLAEGPSVSPEGLELGFEYGIVIEFSNATARDAYLPHPAHRPVADALGEFTARLVVFDLLG